MTSKRTPEEILKAIEEPSLDDEIERVMAMTPDERRAELEAAGFDMNELHAEADAFGAQMKQDVVEDRKREVLAEARARSLRPPRSRQRMVLLLAAAIGTVAVAGGVLATGVGSPSPGPGSSRPETPASPAPSPARLPLPVAARAREFRRRGLAECAKTAWQECLDDLNRARDLEPGGEDDPEVLKARNAAEDALEDKKPPPLK